MPTFPHTPLVKMEFVWPEYLKFFGTTAEDKLFDSHPAPSPPLTLFIHWNLSHLVSSSFFTHEFHAHKHTHVDEKMDLGFRNSFVLLTALASTYLKIHAAENCEVINT